MKNYEHIFSPLKVNSIYLKNRIVAAPVTYYLPEPAPAESLEIIASKARGGAGLIVLGSVAVNDEESVIVEGFSSSLNGFKKTKYLEELSIIHQYGAKASVELHHAGYFAGLMKSHKPTIGPTTQKIDLDEFQGYAGIMPPERKHKHLEVEAVGMDEAMMQKVIDDFVSSAVTAKEIGFDMIMLHFAHGWLIAQFMSPFFNHRKDEYGGSFENRIRFPMRIVEAVREAVGPDYPIDMRIAAKEYVEGGLQVEEVVEFVKRIEDKIDMIHVSSGLDKLLGPTSYIESPSIHPHLINLEFAKAMKKAVKIPVCTVGGITMPDEVEKILADGSADLVALGRGLCADPEWPNKAREGRVKDICPCIRCVSCYPVATGGPSQGCAVNPRYYRELRLRTEEEPAKTRKKVVVVGGGPAGIRAAMKAAERNLQVILLEKENRLGGLLNVSKGDPIKTDMHNYLEYLVYQATHSPNIEVRLQCEATPELVQSLAPDELVVAVGSEPIKPRIPGVEEVSVMDILEAHEHLPETWGPTVIVGGGPSGIEFALSLAEKGTPVSVVEMTDRIAENGNSLYHAAAEIRLQEFSHLIRVYRNTKCERIAKDGVEVCLEDGQRTFIPAERVVCCVGMKPKKELAESFYGLVYDVKMIGDCMGARRINEATHEGYFAGFRI